MNILEPLPEQHASEPLARARRVVRVALALVDGKAPEAAPWLCLQATEEMLRLLHLPNVDRLHTLRCELGDAAVLALAGDLLRDVWKRERMNDARCVACGDLTYIVDAWNPETLCEYCITKEFMAAYTAKHGDAP